MSDEYGSEILDEVSETLRRYVALPSAEATIAVSLWIVATHAVEVAEHATRLAINSPVKRSGKSRLLEVIGGLAHEPLQTQNISSAALFRLIEQAGDRPPTLLLDEADRLFGSRRKDDDNAEIIALLNAGFRRGTPTIRCVGSKSEPKAFPNFAFAAIAGIGRTLPDTVADRSITISMRRRLPHETVEKFRLRSDLPALQAQRDCISKWTLAHLEEIQAAAHDERNMPSELEDRQQDAWEPLIGIAVTAGGRWHELACSAAITLSREAAADDADSHAIRLLSDVRSVFDSQPGDTGFIGTSDLLDGLRDFEDAPWGEADYTARRLASQLRPFGVKPRRDTTGCERGYYRSEFREPFERYLPFEASESSDVSDVCAEQVSRP